MDTSICMELKGQPNWYGQKDSRDTSPIPTIPIALEMRNVQRVNHTPKVVFAENCYGAEIINRSESNALSLHMLGKGTRVFIRSTAIAYGAMNLPLTAADLFGYLYWKHLMTGISCGEAFRRARKIWQQKRKQEAERSTVKSKDTDFICFF